MSGNPMARASQTHTMQSPIAQPRPSHDSQQSATVERLEETATRMSLTAEQTQHYHASDSLERQVRSQLARDFSVRSVRSVTSSRSAHSSLYPTPLNPSSNGDVLSTAAPFTSPLTPSRSLSWSQSHTSGQRSRANSKRLQPRREPEQEGRPLDSLMTRATVSSKTVDYHPIAFDDNEVATHYGPPSAQDQQDADSTQWHGAPMRSNSNVSRSSTLQGARQLFRDFDGTHYTPLEEEIAEEDERSDDDDDDDDDDHDTHALAPSALSRYLPLPSQLLEETDATGEASDPGHPDGQGNPTGLDAIDRTPTKEYPLGRMTMFSSASHSPQLLEVQVGNTEQSFEHSGLRSTSDWAVAAPPDGMVYYPARIPMTLNLPKRISRQPPLHVHKQRRSQLMSSLPEDTLKSVPWLPPIDGIEDPHPTQEDPRPAGKKRQSTAVDLQKLPPQLRASLFFDQTPVKHTPPVRESVVMSLDHMLDEGATTPAGMPVSMADPHRVSTSLFDDSALSGKRASNERDVVRNRESRLNLSTSTLGLKMLEEQDIAVTDDSKRKGVDDGDSAREIAVEQFHESAAQELHDAYEEGQLDDEPVIVQPTTLLAELQLRKAEMKSRNRNAADGFPRGMHSTLMQLDAVAQIEEKRRKTHKTKLAWEGQERDADGTATREDDDVPLALLFRSRSALMEKGAANMDKDRPLGLMEKRELEDNEPLSKRRNRILGIASVEPQLQDLVPSRRSPMPVVGVEERRNPMLDSGDRDNVDDGETLGQRHRRLRASRILDDAIRTGQPGAHGRAISDDFASEMMSQFGDLGLSSGKTVIGAAPDLVAEEEVVREEGGGQKETLGQRRRRLQAERERQTSGEVSAPGDPPRPELRSSQSLANILGDNPIPQNRHFSADQRTPASGLLGASDIALASRRQALLDRNSHAVMYTGSNGPLIDVPRGGKTPIDFRGEVARERFRFAQGQYNDGTGGYGQRTRSPGPQQVMNASGHVIPMGPGSMHGLNGYMHGLPGHQTPHSGQNLGWPPHDQPQSSAQQYQLQQYLNQYAGADVGNPTAKQREQIERWRLSVQD